MPSCAVCSRPAVAAYRPFCSKRCADVDLHRWLAESYAIPADVTDADLVGGGDFDDNDA